MSGRTVLVTGAGGFVGGALVQGFAERGWTVVAVDRVFDDAPAADTVQQITADLAQGVPVGTPSAELVIHAAWFTGDPVSPGIALAEYLSVNVRPLLSVMEFAARTGAADLVFLSSSGVFGPEDGGDGLTDTDRATGDSPYSVSKRVCESLVRVALGPATTRAHVVRLGYLYGPGEVPRPSRPGVSTVARWITAASEGRPLELRPEGPPRDWTFAPDLAPALARLVEGPAVDHPIHLTSPYVLRDRELAEFIASQLPGTPVVTVLDESEGRPLPKPPMVPSELPGLRDFAWTGPMAGLHAVLGEVDLPGAPAVPRRPEGTVTA